MLTNRETACAVSRSKRKNIEARGKRFFSCLFYSCSIQTHVVHATQYATLTVLTDAHGSILADTLLRRAREPPLRCTCFGGFPLILRHPSLFGSKLRSWIIANERPERYNGSGPIEPICDADRPYGRPREYPCGYSVAQPPLRCGGIEVMKVI